jgi:hypothetical protein
MAASGRKRTLISVLFSLLELPLLRKADIEIQNRHEHLLRAGKTDIQLFSTATWPASKLTKSSYKGHRPDRAASRASGWCCSLFTRSSSGSEITRSLPSLIMRFTVRLTVAFGTFRVADSSVMLAWLSARLDTITALHIRCSRRDTPEGDTSAHAVRYRSIHPSMSRARSLQLWDGFINLPFAESQKLRTII